MPDSSTSMLRRALTWLFVMLLSAVMVVAAVELNYRYGFRAARNAEDMRLRTLELTRSKSFRSVLFSDSMTHSALRDYVLSPQVLDLSTTNGPTLLGIRFMLQRFFANNNTTREVVIFLRPEFVTRDLSTLQPGIFLWFDRAEEVAELEKHGVGGFSWFDVHLKNRVDALNVLSHTINRERLRKRPFSSEYQLEQDIITARFETVDTSQVQLRRESTQLIESIIALTREHRIQLTLVLEPLISKDYALTRNAPLTEYLRQLGTMPGVRFLDANTLVDVKDAMFFDGVHPRKNWARYYLMQIDRHITPVL